MCGVLCLCARQDTMIRERVSTHGVLRPLEPEEELTAFKLPSEVIGEISELAVRRWMDGTAKFGKKFGKTAKAIEKAMELLKGGADPLAHVLVDRGQRLRRLLQQRHVEPAPDHRLGHLHADVAAADDDRPARRRIAIEPVLHGGAVVEGLHAEDAAGLDARPAGRHGHGAGQVDAARQIANNAIRDRDHALLAMIAARTTANMEALDALSDEAVARATAATEGDAHEDLGAGNEANGGY